MSLQSLNTDLLALETSLDALKISYPQAAREAASAKIAYELKYAEAIDSLAHEATVKASTDPKFKQTVAQAEASAMLRVKADYKTYRESEAEVNALKMQVDILQSILMSTQSRTKLMLIERNMEGAQL